jgi:hypothetical protein
MEIRKHVLFGGGLLTAVVLGTLFLLRRPPVRVSEEKALLEGKQESRGQVVARRNDLSSVTPLPNPGAREAEKQLSEETFDMDRRRKDPVYAQRVKRHIQIRYYMQSPAKDTPECEAVRVLLMQYGIGLEGVGEAYNFAWDYATWTKRISNAPTLVHKTGLEQMREMRYDSAVTTFSSKYGITNAALIDALIKIQPKVFFGTYNPSLQQGEPLY